jgi:hypothetical protein
MRHHARRAPLAGRNAEATAAPFHTFAARPQSPAGRSSPGSTSSTRRTWVQTCSYPPQLREEELNFVGVPIAQRSAAPAIAQIATRRAGGACPSRAKASAGLHLTSSRRGEIYSRTSTLRARAPGPGLWQVVGVGLSSPCPPEVFYALRGEAALVSRWNWRYGAPAWVK